MFSSKSIKNIHRSLGLYLNKMHGGAFIVPSSSPIWLQVIETIGIVLVFSITVQILEHNFKLLKKYQHMAVDIYPLSYNTAQEFIQDPSSCFPILGQSQDERNGAEYAYSCFINVSSDTFIACEKNSNNNNIKHLFHKGSPTVFPLMAPGVFMKADTNTLRVYHNSTKKWNNYVDVENIPLNKWIHLVIMLKGNYLEVYINGNLANRLKFNDVPKLNYSSFYLLNDFNQENSIGNITNVTGAASAHISRVKYFTYALSFSQIDKLLREGPNKILYTKKTNRDEFAYLTDEWATSKDHIGTGPE